MMSAQMNHFPIGFEELSFEGDIFGDDLSVDDMFADDPLRRFPELWHELFEDNRRFPENVTLER
eukprot:540182-Prorocentrum_minimum.AAC.1